MSDFIKKFKNIWEYRNAYSGLPQPNIVYVENDGIIDFNPEDRIIIKISLDNSTSVTVVSQYTGFTEVEVDGVKYDPMTVGTLTLDAGEHTIKYSYNTNAVFTSSTFGALSYVTSMVVPEGVETVSNFLPYFNSNTEGNSLSFPESIESITGEINLAGRGGCYIICKAKTPPTLESGMHFINVGTLFVPAESVNLYSTSVWGTHFNTILPIEASAL